MKRANRHSTEGMVHADCGGKIAYKTTLASGFLGCARCGHILAIGGLHRVWLKTELIAELKARLLREAAS